MRLNGNPRGLAGSRGGSQNSLLENRHAIRDGCRLDYTSFDACIVDPLLDFLDEEFGELRRRAATQLWRKESLAGTHDNLHSRLSRDLFGEANVAPALGGAQTNDSVYTCIPRRFELVDCIGNG